MNYKKTTLKNNLRIITAPMKETKTVTIMIGVGVGSRYERDDEAGISHFIEHMMFKGTKKRPVPRKIYEEIDSVGGKFNAFTGKSRTFYYVKVDAKHTDRVLDVIFDIFLNSKMDSREIEKERGTILQELSMYEDLPMKSVTDVFEKLLYGKHPLGREIIGTKKTINNLKREDFLNYLKQFYVASNTVVCVAGQLNENDILKKINNYFSKIRKGNKIDFERVTEKQASPKIKIKNKKSDQTHFILGVRAYNREHKDYYVMQLLANIFGGNMSSRLFIEIREKRGLAYYINADSEEYQDVGYFSVSAGVQHNKVKEVLEIILKEFKKITKRKVSELELQKAKDCIKGKMVMNLESSDAVAGFLLGQEILRGKIDDLKTVFKKIDKVTVDDILRVSKDIFVSEKLNLAIVGPQKRNERAIKRKLII